MYVLNQATTKYEHFSYQQSMQMRRHPSRLRIYLLLFLCIRMRCTWYIFCRMTLFQFKQIMLIITVTSIMIIERAIRLVSRSFLSSFHISHYGGMSLLHSCLEAILYQFTAVIHLLTALANIILRLLNMMRSFAVFL